MKPNVLQLTDSFFQGGTERHVVQLTRLLHESGRFRQHVACLNGAGPLRAEVERLNLGEIPVFPLRSFYDANAAAQVRRLARFIREREIDIVHAHDFYTNIFGMAAAALARASVRVASRRETDGIRSFAKRFVERRAYNLAHNIVANSEAVKDALVSEGVRADKIVVHHNGLDTRRLALPAGWRREDALASLGLPTNRRYVTIVANMLHVMKDQATFLRAARTVREQIPDAAFALAGEGPQEDSLRALASELGLEGDTFFLGRCRRVPELLAASEVCVLSSRGVEGFSNSILEYMAASRPVVATDVGGAREAVTDGETGYIIAPGDAEALAARVISLLREPERARAMGERGRRRVEENFSCAAQLERAENLYGQLLLTARGRVRSRLSVEEKRREELRRDYPPRGVETGSGLVNKKYEERNHDITRNSTKQI